MNICKLIEDSNNINGNKDILEKSEGKRKSGKRIESFAIKDMYKIFIL